MLNLLQTFISIWGTNLKFKANVNRIKDVRDKIAVVAGIQITSAKGATKGEHYCWSVAADIAEHVCFGLKSYFEDEDDDISLGEINYTYSDFAYGARLDALNKMKKVAELLEPITITDLEDYFVLATDKTELHDAIEAFEASVPEHDTIVATTSTATEELPELFTTYRKEIYRLDNRMKALKKTQPTFYKAYKNSRKIKNLGKGQQAAEMTLMAKEFLAVFGAKFEAGYWFTIRNHSGYPATAMLTDKPNELLVANEVIIPPHSDLKVEVPNDFNNVFGHWLMIYNGNKLDDIHVTVIMSKTMSQSNADEVVNLAKD